MDNLNFNNDQNHIRDYSEKPLAQAVVIYKSTNHVYLYGEEEQLKTLCCNIEGTPFDLKISYRSVNSWGPHLEFTSISSVYTFLLRNGFIFFKDTKAYSGSEQDYFLEIWIKDV